MTKKLWQTTTNSHALIEDYTSGKDLLLDTNLIEFDIYGSLAHARMLYKQGLIEKQDFEQIKDGLKKILNQFLSGEMHLTLGDEDTHTKIETELTKLYPTSGAMLHTGRSRNDQVLVAIRLYTKSQIIKITQSTIALIDSLLQLAETYQNVPLAGMTHMQPAMLSSFGLWLGSFAESLLDDVHIVKNAFELTNQSPLGSGAAYGVTLSLDRQLTADLLGFEKVQNNALYCQNSRGKIEATIMHALSQIMATLNKYATDCLLFTTEPFGYITFAKELGTGSSIMPQKQNWDALELMRSKYHQIVATHLQISTSLANIPSGYNRDVQQTKEQFFSAFQTTLQSLQVAQLHVESMSINQEKVKQHIPKELFAAHWAYVLVKEEYMPFREAYRYVKDHLDEIPDFDCADLLKKACSQGSTGNLQLNSAQKRSRLERTYWWEQSKQFQKKIHNILT